ncbi:MAG TPA: CRTAC1 family protein [Chthonomonadaceae bacterium]|nr:CRTAC1 family protein [Chthonomonadaceae bacterium]
MSRAGKRGTQAERLVPWLLMALALLLAGCSGSPEKHTVRPAKAEVASAASGRFVDIAAQSGITFQHTDGSSGRKFFVEQMGSGVAIFDYDNDGWPDLYFCSGAPLPGYKGPKPSNRLYHNNHDGTFTDVTEKAGVGCGRYAIGVAVADYDNDGYLDMYICCFGGNVLYHNNHDGTFTDVTARAGVGGGKRLSSSAAWGDFDGDGYLDLYVCNYVKYRLDQDLFCSKFQGHKSYCGPNLYEPELHTLYHNNGDGTFTDVSEKAGIHKKAGNGLGVVWLDYNDDGKPDIFVANDQSPNFLWRNNGNGTFTEMAEELGVAYGEQGNTQAGMGVDAADVDNDGRLDILVTNFSEESNALYHNEGGRFRDISFPSGMGPATLRYLGFGTAFLDYDRDGLLDMFFANGHVLDDIDKYSDSVTWAQSNQLFRNRGDKTFEEVSQVTGIADGKRVSRGAAFGDLFNRGCTDIVVNVLRSHPLVLRNECAPNANWLELDLHASWGNPQAIGTKVWLTAGGVTQRRDVKMNYSYASSSDPRPLFGLGQRTQVDQVKIRWPSGQETIIKGPPINRILRVDEPPQTRSTVSAASHFPTR